MSCSCVKVNDNTEPLENLLRFVMPYVPALPYELAFDFLRQAYIEFAVQSSLLASEQTLHMQKDVKLYKLEPPEGYEVYALLDVSQYNGTYLRFPNKDGWYFSWGQRFRLIGNEYIEFECAPSKDYDGKRLGLHLIPTSCVDSIPKEISTPFGEGIAAGALARAYEIPKKEWTSFDVARLKRRDFARTALQGRNVHITNRGAKVPEFRPVRIL